MRWPPISRYANNDTPFKFMHPKISVITPNYNCAEFLERTIQSVLAQNYPNLEYIVMDGGSTDGSVEIIKKYAAKLAYWISEPDEGQADAINKGLRLATGEWVAWQNSDDIYYPGALQGLARAASYHPDVDLIIGNMMLIDQSGGELRDIHYVTPTHNALLAEGMVLTNQAAFWRRSVHAEIGWLNASLHCSFDYEWFLRLTKNRKASHVNEMWGGYRLHDATKTSNLREMFVQENRQILQGRTISAWMKRLYQFRRLGLLLARGDFYYVARGLVRRLSGKSGDFY